jgi:hypothetical protein
MTEYFSNMTNYFLPSGNTSWTHGHYCHASAICRLYIPLSYINCGITVAISMPVYSEVSVTFIILETIVILWFGIVQSFFFKCIGCEQGWLWQVSDTHYICRRMICFDKLEQKNDQIVCHVDVLGSIRTKVPNNGCGLWLKAYLRVALKTETNESYMSPPPEHTFHCVVILTTTSKSCSCFVKQNQDRNSETDWAMLRCRVFL